MRGLKFKIQSLDSLNFESFLKIYKEIFPQKNITIDQIHHIAFNEPSTVFLAMGHKNPLGFLYFWTVNDEIQIMDLGVMVSYRHQGIAYCLLKAMIKQARGTKIKKITLEVRSNNKTAIGLYERVGFIKTAVRKKYYPDGCDALLMDYCVCVVWFSKIELHKS